MQEGGVRWTNSSPCRACKTGSAPCRRRTSATCSACTKRPLQCYSQDLQALARRRLHASCGSWWILSELSMPQRYYQDPQTACAGSWQDRRSPRLTMCGGLIERQPTRCQGHWKDWQCPQAGKSILCPLATSAS